MCVQYALVYTSLLFYSRNGGCFVHVYMYTYCTFESNNKIHCTVCVPHNSICNCLSYQQCTCTVYMCIQYYTHLQCLYSMTFTGNLHRYRIGSPFTVKNVSGLEIYMYVEKEEVNNLNTCTCM